MTRDLQGNPVSPQRNEVREMVQDLIARFEASNLSLPLEEVGHEVYRYGHRRLALKVQGGRLVVRGGGGFWDLMEFLEKVQVP